MNTGFSSYFQDRPNTSVRKIRAKIHGPRSVQRCMPKFFLSLLRGFSSLSLSIQLTTFRSYNF